MTLPALLLSIIFGIGSLAWGYNQVGLSKFAEWILIFGGVWLFAVWRRWRWFSYIGLAFSFLGAALGLWFLDFTPGWMFAGVIGALLGWDLTDFLYRLRFSASAEERRIVERRHLRRVTLLALLGLLLASIAMLLKLQFNFDWALLLVVVAALGIMQVVSWFRRRR